MQLGYEFHNPSLLQAALTHRSIRGNNNERLEFLGDSLLNCIISMALFQKYPRATEGKLSRLRASLVNGETLAAMAQEFNIGTSLRLGSSELKSGGAQRKSILADAMEAIIAAIYLDSDMKTCETCILKWFEYRFSKLAATSDLKDPKTRLQEYLQAKKIPLPLYRVLSIQGKEHQQTFHVQCQVKQKSNMMTEGAGNSRRAAEQDAAEKYLALLLEQEIHE